MISLSASKPVSRGARTILAFIVFAPLVAAAVQVTAVTGANADQVLRPGDVMIKLLNEKSQASSWGIAVSEGAIQAVYRGFSEAASKGNPAAVHVAIYVGKAQTAEAHGKSSEDQEGVGLRNVEHHAGYLWYVYRPKDPRIGEEAAKVARTWATGRMKYKLPWNVAFHDSDFGPFAKHEALGYGKAASTPGGPPSDSAMFCSQFAIAVYQAAMVSQMLQSNPKLNFEHIQVIGGMDRHASKTSPLVLQGHLRSTGGFTEIGLIVTQTAKK